MTSHLFVLASQLPHRVRVQSIEEESGFRLTAPWASAVVLAYTPDRKQGRMLIAQASAEAAVLSLALHLTISQKGSLLISQANFLQPGQ